MMQEKLIVIFSERHKIGMTATPYMASIPEGDVVVTIHEQLTMDRLNTSSYKLNEIEKKVVKTLDEITDKKLKSKFSKEKNIKLFYDKLTTEILERRIRPELEKRIIQCMELLTLTPETLVFFKETNYSNIYNSDRINIPLLPSEAVFHFNLDDEGLDYTLRIKDGDREFGLIQRELTYITHSPCTFLLSGKLYRFTDIDSNKLKPFIEKASIRIPKSSVKNYLEKFVLNCIRDYEVIGKGFDIIDKTGIPRAILSLEQDLNQQPVLSLKFNYETKSYLAGTKSKIFVELFETDSRYTFHKLKRLTNWENQILDSLNELGLISQNDCQFKPQELLNTNPSDTLYTIIEWLNKNSKNLADKGIEIQQSLNHQIYNISGFNLKTSISDKNDWFELEAIIEINEFKIPFIKFRKHIQQGNREFVLPDKSIFILPEEWFTKYTEIMHFAKSDEQNNLLINKVYFNLLSDAGLGKFNKQDTLNKLQQISDTDIVKTIIPSGLNAQLRPYQIQGFSWMNHLLQNKVGGILADDMGLGKTVQTITLLLNHYEQESNGSTEHNQQLTLFGDSKIGGFNNSSLPPSIIVMPTSLIHNWENEIKKFAPTLKSYLYVGQNRIKSKDIGKILRHYHVIITSYGVVRNDIDYLKTFEFFYLILDESQYIKNPASKTYDAVMDLKGKHRIVLTGTPIENSLNDLWAQMNFANHSILGSLNYFKNHFVTPIVKHQNEEVEKRLQSLISPYILRRTKNMVARELPPVTEQTVYCDMTPEQKKIYEREKSGVRNKLLKLIEKQGAEKSSMITLQALTRLRQLANHPVLIEPNYKGQSGKFEQILEHIDNIISEKHKVLIFSSFVKDLELISSELNRRKYKFSVLNGSTNNRQEVIRQFTKNDDCRIFLISLKAGGVGLNLTEADYVFMLNPWWNPAAEAQAINRAHRIGQTKSVFVYRFISTDTIEEKIAKLQEKKQALADTFINANNPFKNLTETQIKELFA